MVGSLNKLGARHAAFQVLNFLMIVSSALMIWKGLAVVTNSESPIVVVLSGSMEPAFQRGDLLFLSMDSGPLAVGDICVYKVPGRDVPIVHRIIKVHDPADGGEQLILTKGDNNNADDRGLYNAGQLWLHRGDIVGCAKGFVPYAGAVTILMNDYPWFKFALLGGLAVFVLVSRE